MLHVESVCTPCCMFCVSLSVACCQELLRKVWNRSSFLTTPNISFVPWSPKSSVTMLDLFAQLFQHCLGHADALHVSSFKFTKPYRPRLDPSHDALQVPTLFGAVASVCTSLISRTQQYWPNNVESCCVRHVALHPVTPTKPFFLILGFPTSGLVLLV